jgi:hypothetical protein
MADDVKFAGQKHQNRTCSRSVIIQSFHGFSFDTTALWGKQLRLS